jgi:hypothetical protein
MEMPTSEAICASLKPRLGQPNSSGHRNVPSAIINQYVIDMTLRVSLED